MAESGYNVGDLVAEFLSQIGVSTCFGIVSVHNIPMLDAIGRRNAVRYVMARGEVVFSGDVAELRADEDLLRALYLGETPSESGA